MKKLSLLTASLLLLTAGGCEVIEQVPQSALTQTNFFRNADDAEAAVVSSYDALQTLDRQLVLWGDFRTDNTEMPIKVFGTTDPSILDIMNDNISATTGQVNWNPYYVGINRANNIIKSVPGIQDPSINAIRERVLGEALFIRALNYFMLVRLWGAVPLVLEPSVSLSQDYRVARTEANAILDQVVKDLIEAEQKLPASYATNLDTRGRATKGGAQALLAKVYLQRKNWQLAADKANAVLQSTVYSLVPGEQYETIFTARNTTEAIFELQYSNLTQDLNGMVQAFMPRASAGGGEALVIPSQKLINAFETGDRRKGATIKISTNPPFNLGQPLQNGMPYNGKYTGTLVGTARFSDSNIVLLRLADVILMRAEALAQLGQTPEAITLLNRIRTRAGLPATTATTKEAVLLAIEQERFVELAFEGHRFFDLVRTERVQPVIGAKKLLLPVQQTQLDLNPNLLPQNPGY